MTRDRKKIGLYTRTCLKHVLVKGNFKVFLNTEVLYSIGFLQSLKNTDIIHQENNVKSLITGSTRNTGEHQIWTVM